MWARSHSPRYTILLCIAEHVYYKTKPYWGSSFSTIFKLVILYWQRIGVTATLPDIMPASSRLNRAGPLEWNFWGKVLYHNERFTSFTRLPSLHDLAKDQSVGLFVTKDGQLHLYRNGNYAEGVATGLPVDKHLWGAIAVYGKCTKIKSEMLSGELMMCVCTVPVIKRL